MLEVRVWMSRFAAGIALGLAILPAGLRAAETPPLFFDDFVTLRPGWGVANEMMTVDGNRLVLNLPPNLSRLCLYSPVEFMGLDLRMKVAQIKGNEHTPGGVTFWATDVDDLYVARIAPDGRFSVGRRMHGRWLSPVFSRVCQDVRKGPGEVNELRVVTSGRSVTVYVTDRQAVAFNGFPPGKRSEIGVYGESGADPAVWAFSALSVRQGPVPPAVKGPRDTLLFADDFLAPDPAWGPSNDNVSVQNGKLMVTPRPNQGYHVFYQGTLLENADIAVIVNQIDGGRDFCAGIVFWATDHQSFYTANLRPDGVFFVSRRVNGRWLYPVASKVRDELAHGFGQANQLRVVTSGRSATVYANDKQLVTFNGFPPQGGSLIGLHVESGDEPYTWDFSEFSVCPGPVPPNTGQPQDDLLLLADDFATLDPAWGEANQEKFVGDNKLKMNPRRNAIYRTLYQGRLFGDAKIRVKVAATKGGGHAAAGLLFWSSDAAHFYAALIGSDGGLFVGQSINDKWQPIVPGQVRKEVLQGLDQANELRVVTRGNSATIYINDKQVGAFQGAPPEGGSMIGLRAESEEKEAYSWEFSDLVVRNPP